jgi:carbon-monoxide dehydrogenase medium subunit
MNMSFKPKEYFKPKTLNETLNLLINWGERARLVAGGTDLLVERPIQCECLIDINDLPLKYIKKDSECIRIGATTNFNEIIESKYFSQGPLKVISESSKLIGHRNIRNLATIGGNICNAVPSLDSAPPLISLDAFAVIKGLYGERKIPLEEFFVFVRKTVLKKGELLKEVRIPNPPSRTGTCFSKIGRSKLDIALVNCSVRLTFDENDRIEAARVVLGSVAPTPVRTKGSEMMLVGNILDEELIGKVSQKASSEIKPISDVRSSAEYRREVCRVLVERNLKEANRRAKEG